MSQSNFTPSESHEEMVGKCSLTHFERGQLPGGTWLVMQSRHVVVRLSAGRNTLVRSVGRVYSHRSQHPDFHLYSLVVALLGCLGCLKARQAPTAYWRRDLWIMKPDSAFTKLWC